MGSDEIGLRGVLDVAGRRWKVIAVTVAACVLAASAFALTRTPQYDATATLLAGQGGALADITAVTAINQATQTLAPMSTDRVVLERAIKDLELDVDAGTLEGRVSSSVPANTQQIIITVTDPDPERAALLANGIARAFSDLVDDKASAESNLSASLWQPAIVPAAPASPNVPLLVLMGLVGGLVLGVALAAVREALDMRWRDERSVEHALGVPVLAVIPEISTKAARQKVYA